MNPQEIKALVVQVIEEQESVKTIIEQAKF
jgi:hypothetical protein